MQCDLVDAFTICPDQASVPYPSTVVAVNCILPVADQVNKKRITRECTIHCTGEPDQPVIGFNVPIGIGESLIPQQA
jgi:hypothetical protein